jgi:hypothetical protein
LIANFFRVAASAVFSAEEVRQFLILDQPQVIEDPDELISSDEVALGSIVVLERRLDKYSFAFDRPSDIIQDLI